MLFEMGLLIKRLPVFLLPLLLIVCVSCTAIRTIWWGHADADDYKKFGLLPIAKSGSPVHFIKKSENTLLRVPGSADTSKDFHSFDVFLELHNTLCFIVIRNDTVLYEKYFHGYDNKSVFPSFSVSKSFVSALTGIALKDHAIKNLKQPVTDFIPDLKDPGFTKVTLDDLLSMRSGIRFEEEYSSPFSKMSKFYYGKNLKKYTLELKTETTAGIDYNYQSANAQLMALVLERATGKKINEYFEEKIWKPAGMESDASWSIDSRKHQTVKAFCCVTARGLDYARFGELYLHGGKNGPVQVIPEEWIKETSTIKYDSRDSEGFPYTYFWRVTEQGNLFAKGVLGQYIFVCPRKNIVVVRFGQGTGNISWARFIEQLMDQFP